MKNKKKTLIIFVIIVCIIVIITGGIILFLNKDKNELKETNKVSSGNFAMYVENESGGYELVDSWPDSTYRLNKTKTVCVDNDGNTLNNSVSYSNGKIEFTTSKAVYCYLYFDVTTDISITISTDGKSGTLPTKEGYKASVSCDNATASFSQKYQRIEFSDVSSNETKCTLNYTKDTTSYTSLINKVQSSSTTNNNGYRYSGKNPNNYIWFNNEMWRIIGSIPTKQLDGSTSNLVKIIREDSIGGIAYDAIYEEYTGEWGKNTLYTHLNTHYYADNIEDLDGTDSSGCKAYAFRTVRPKCDYTSSGILSSSYYGKMVQEVYWNTGASDYAVTPATAYTNETGTQTVKGYVGLMNASDYGYATSSTYLSNNLTLNGYGAGTPTWGGGITDTNTSGNAASDNWLYKGNEYTLTQYLDSTYSYENYTLYIDYRGFVYYSLGANSYSGTDEGIAVRPVVYLNKNVYVISGSGSITDPYIIGM